jgi:hypothetical protein
MEMPAMLKWKKIGGGSLRLQKRIIKPGQIFEAYEEDIPASFRKLVICLSDDVLAVATAKKLEEAKKPEILYEIKERSKGWFDIVNIETGKKVNERGLRDAEAKDLLKTLKS